MSNSFNEQDRKKVVDFLNMVANKATFQLSTQELITYYGLLSFMQKELLQKIDSNIQEVKRVYKDQEENSDQSEE